MLMKEFEKVYSPTDATGREPKLATTPAVIVTFSSISMVGCGEGFGEGGVVVVWWWCGVVVWCGGGVVWWWCGGVV